MHPHILLRTQIWNILRKWQRIRWSTVFSHFPKDRNCDVSWMSKFTKASDRRHIGGAPLRAEKFGDLITADHIVLNEGCESWDTHHHAVVVHDLTTQWILFFYGKQNLHKSRREHRNCKYRQLGGIWESMWGFVTESPHFNTSSNRDKWHLWKSRPTSKGRYAGCIVKNAIAIPKCPRALGRRENVTRQTIWRTIRASENLFKLGWRPSVFTARSGENSSIRRSKYVQESSWALSWSDTK